VTYSPRHVDVGDYYYYCHDEWYVVVVVPEHIDVERVPKYWQWYSNLLVMPIPHTVVRHLLDHARQWPN
jgi:hypothetical protein